MRSINVELLCTEETYDVRIENDNGEKVAYTLIYNYEENVGWSNITIYDDDGKELLEGGLKEQIIKIFNNMK